MILILESRPPLPRSITMQRLESNGRGGCFYYIHESYIKQGLLSLNMGKNPLGGHILMSREVL